MTIFEKLHKQIKYLEAIIKYKNGKSSTLTLIILTPFFITILLILKLWRLLIYLFLKLKFGSSFLGLMEGPDSFHAIIESEESRSVVTILILTEFNSGNFLEYTKYKLDEIFKRDNLAKLRSTREKLCSFYFYKIAEKWGEFKLFEEDSREFMSQERLQKEISEFMNEEMPFGNKGMCHVLLGNKALVGGKFPIVLRFHHCFGDAVTFFNLIAKEFPNQPRSPLTNQENQIKPGNNKLDKNMLNKPMKSVGFFDDFKDNAFRCQYLRGKKHLVWYSEKEPQFLNKIKNIKKKTNATFMGIILTALSTSLIDYAKHKSQKNEEQLTYLITCMLDKVKFIYGVDNYECNNKFTLSLLKVPFTHNSNDLQKRFIKICEEYSDLKNNSLDDMFNRWIGTDLLNTVPSWFNKLLLDLHKPNVILSNIPGCNSSVQFGDNKITDIVIFDPNGKQTGITMMFTTYEDRISLGFTFDVMIVPDLEDGEKILNDFLKCIDLLYNTYYNIKD